MERRDLAPDSDPSGRCPACGVAAPTGAAACPACGEPLLSAIDDAPLPPLPDGGLAALMPAWLRDAPSDESRSPVGPAPPGSAPEDRAPSPSSANARPTPVAGAPDVAAPATASAPVDEVAAHAVIGADDAPRSFDPAALITADDLPAWLRAIGAPPPAGQPPESAAASPAIPAAEAVAAPVYLPRAGLRPAAAAADLADGRSAREDVAGVALDAGSASVAPTVTIAGHAVASPTAKSPDAASPSPGDEGALPPAAERAESGTADDLAGAGAHAATGKAPTGAANPPTASPDPARDDAPESALQEGVAAGIATLAILIVAAAIVFLIVRALAGQ